jgi:hypothetical protein
MGTDQLVLLSKMIIASKALSASPAFLATRSQAEFLENAIGFLVDTDRVTVATGERSMSYYQLMDNKNVISALEEYVKG